MSTPNESATIVESMTKDASNSIPKGEKEALPSQQASRPFHPATILEKIYAAVDRPRWRRLAYLVAGILLITLWCGVTDIFAQTEIKDQDKNYEGAYRLTETSRGDNKSQEFFLLSGDLARFDGETRTLTITWSGLYLLNGIVEPFGSSTNSNYTIGLYVNEEVYIDNDPTYGLHVDNLTALPVGVFTNPWQSYDIDIGMGPQVMRNAWRQPEYGFPFDHWSGSITFGATFRDCSLNVTESNRCGTSWDYAYLTGSIINWKFALTLVDTCKDMTVPTCNLIATVTASRSGLVVFACVVAVMVNWMSTLFIFVMTMEGVVMQRFEVIEGPQLLAVCFTALFALPSVRSILPGAPEFGALIDLIGIVPNVIIISLCTTMVAIATLRKFIHRNNERLQEKKDLRAAALAAEQKV